MRVELLTAKPVSGSVPERHFNVSAESNTWVRFIPEDEDDWVGVFGNGLWGYSTAVPFTDDHGPMVLVIARGQGYIVDPRTGALIRQTPWDYSFSAVAPPGRDFVLIADETNIWATRRDRDIDIRAHNGEGAGEGDPTRIALDGIILDEPGPRAVTGKAWFSSGWYAFTLDYDTLEAEIGSPLNAEWGDAYLASKERGGSVGSPAYYEWLKRFSL